jgi:hypothetical protein
MEADWSVEIAPELPEIHVPWEGFIDLRQTDLRQTPAELQAIAEAARFPALAHALTTLNTHESSVFTAKSDIWTMPDAEIDPYEFAALPENAHCGVASYIDLLARDTASLASFEFHESRARQIVHELHGLDLLNGRIDLVIRAAVVDGVEGYGITLYAAGCGTGIAQARTSWESVLTAAVLATIRTTGSTSPPALHTGE